MRAVTRAVLLWIGCLWVAAHLACSRPGPGGQPVGTKPVDLSDFGRGSRLTYRIKTKLDAQLIVEGNQSRIGANEQFTVNVTGNAAWLEVQLQEMSVRLTVNGRLASHVKLAADGLEGRIGEKSLAKAAGASDDELAGWSRKFCAEPFVRIQLDELAQELDRERLAPLESDVFVSPAFVEFVQLLLAPLRVDEPTWTRQCRFPLGEGIEADGSLSYLITEPDWQARHTKWFLPVDVHGTFTADGTHTARLIEDLPSAKSGKVKTATLRYSDSSYNLNGHFVLSRQTGQFESGTLNVAVKHAIQQADERVQLTGTRVITLESVTSDRTLPVPRADLALVSEPCAAKPDDSPRSCLGASQWRHTRWHVDLDLAFPDGVLPPAVTADGSAAFLLDPGGLLRRMRLSDLTIERTLLLGKDCRGLAWGGKQLVVLQRDRLIVLDPTSLEPQQAWQCPGGSSLSGCRKLPWVVVGFADSDTVWIVDVEQKCALYTFQPDNLRRVSPPPATGLKRVRPERLMRGALAPDGSQFVLLGNAFHRFSRRDEQLYYEEDSAQVNSDGQWLSLSEDGQRLAIRSATGHGPPFHTGVPKSAGVYVYDLSAMDKPLITTGPSSWVKRFVENDLLLVSAGGVLRNTVTPPPKKATSTVLIRLGSDPGVGELVDAVPLPSADACLGLGRVGSCWIGHREAVPGLLKQPLPVATIPIACDVEKLSGPVAAPSELSEFPCLTLPAPLLERHFLGPLHARHQLAFSADGRFFFALLQDGSLVRGDMEQRRLTHRATPSMKLTALSACPATLVASSYDECYLFDQDDLACTGQLDVATSHNVIAASQAANGVSISGLHPSLLWFDFEKKRCQRVALSDIAGLEDDKINGISEALKGPHDSRFNRLDVLQIAPDGQRVLMRVYYGMFVLRTGPTWTLESHWKIPPRETVTACIGSDRLALVDKKNYLGQVKLVDWHGNGEAEVEATGVYSGDRAWYNALSDRWYAFYERDLREFDQRGSLLRTLPVGTASCDAFFGHPQRMEMLIYFSGEKTLCWRPLNP